MTEKAYITPNEVSGETDSARIRAAIALAVERGTLRVRIPRRNERTGEDLWVIGETVELPSGIELLIDDAHLVLETGKYLNMFVTGDRMREGGRTPEGATRNVTLRGRGRAVLDGGVYNGLSEKNSGKDGLPHISNNTTLLFFNTDGLLVEDLSVVNQRWWGITNVFVRNAVFRNLHFRSDFSRVDENGVHHPDERPRCYSEVYVKNADGIDLRIGCHNVLIENVTGFTEDDSVALTALGGFERKLGYVVEGLSPDIHDVEVRSVSTDCYCSSVRLLNDNGYRLYNVTVDGVRSCRAYPGHVSHAVRIGDTVYADTPSVLGDTHHITVRNVISSATYGVAICKGLVDSTVENVIALEGKVGVGVHPKQSAELVRCRIGNVMSLSTETEALSTERMTLVDCELPWGEAF